MSKLPLEIKRKAIALRKRGYSVKEIAEKLHIAKSTSSLWVREIKLNKKAQQRLKQKKLLRYYKSSLTWQKRRKEEEREYSLSAAKIVKQIKKDPNHLKVYCALLYWCEGGKNWKDSLRFVNSDPSLVRSFLCLFRKAFPVNEKKFRIIMHLHEYHDENKQKKFWSNLTKIPEEQFNKIFWKPHTKKRIKKDYPGCVAIYYYDCKTARKIRAIYKAFAQQLGTW